MNIPNTGQAVGLPADAVIESICVIDGDGIRGRDRHGAARIPTTRSCAATWPPRSSPSRRRSGATARWPAEAFALDPLAGRGDLRATEAMVDELLAGTAEWLPQFA